MSTAMRFVALVLVGLSMAPLGSVHSAGKPHLLPNILAMSSHSAQAVAITAESHPAHEPAALRRPVYPDKGLPIATSTRSSTPDVTTPIWVRSFGANLIGSDSNAAYWFASLTANPKVTWAITGTYPSARYTSIQAYTGTGTFVTGLADWEFPPDTGSINPFVAGTQRGVGTYTLHLVFGPAPSPPVSGTLYVNAPAGAGVVLVYRVYLPDTGASASGNVPLPVFSVSSHATSTGTALQRDRQAVRGHTFIAAGRPYVVQPAVPYIRQGGIGSYGYGDADDAYLFGAMPVTTTMLYVVRFAAPTTPRTLAGEPFNPNTQLRYWSVCVYEANYYPHKCLADEQVPQKPLGQALIAMGLASERPTNANARNGVAWISLGTNPMYGVLVRNLLPATNFTMSAFAVPFGATPVPYMGPYAPVAVTCTTADFESNECAGSAP